MAGGVLSFDAAYMQWRRKFAPFEASCFDALCEFARVNFERLIDRYYREGHESLNDFPSWVFECYLRETAP